MRKCINGVSAIVQNSFKLDPFHKVLFVFCNKQRNRLKILTWEDNGTALLDPMMKKLKQELLTRQVLHADEMTLEVLCEPGRPAKFLYVDIPDIWRYKNADCIV